MEDCGELEEWMFDSFNKNKRKLNNDVSIENEEEWNIPDEMDLDGCFQNMPATQKPNSKRSPYIHRDQIIEEDEECDDFVDPNQQYGFKNLNSYISQMDKWIEEGKTFK